MQTIIEFPVVPANRSRTQIVVYVELAFTYYVSPPATLIWKSTQKASKCPMLLLIKKVKKVPYAFKIFVGI